MVESALRLPSIKSWNSRNMRRQLQRGPLATPCIEILTVTLLSNIQEIFIRAFSTAFFATSLGFQRGNPTKAQVGRLLPWPSIQGAAMIKLKRPTVTSMVVKMYTSGFLNQPLGLFCWAAWNSQYLTIYDHIWYTYLYIHIYIYVHST